MMMEGKMMNQTDGWVAGWADERAAGCGSGRVIGALVVVLLVVVIVKLSKK
jgi:hypothetical protein